ncbi:MAG TPA: isoprenylcysteine carboxylmethyltransferase family protein [Solirubrobacterales bacterium]
MRQLPDLGSRGEGWVAIQGVFLVIIGAGAFAGPAWAGGARIAGVIAGLALMGAGAFAGLAGIRDLRESLTALPAPRDGGRLVEDGIYRHVRHPIYGGVILGSLGWSLVFASPVSLVASLVLAGFFDLKARREERWLAERYSGYVDYRRRTRKLVPGVY